MEETTPLLMSTPEPEDVEPDVFENEPLPVNETIRNIVIIERDMIRFIMSCINLFATIVTMIKIIYPS